MQKAKTIARLLNIHQKELFDLLNKAKYQELVNRIDNLVATEGTEIDGLSKKRCWEAFHSSINKPSKLAATLWTWMNPEDKIGRY